SARGDAFFGEGNGLIWNDINECIGNELRLSDCPVASWGHHQCTHKNDAGVICSGEPWQVRLVNGESVCDGRVEVYYGGFWGRVIDTEWNFNDADVVCRQLNCGAAINVYNNWKFGKGDGPVWISNVRCNGSEPFLWNCSITQGKQLSIAGDVGVVCSDHIQVRLADGGSRCAGRVELYYNGTWGTVCDDLWDLADAHVVCNQLKCGQALNATVFGWFGTGAGPIWLHNLMCATNDSVLWECPGDPRNESNCNHKEDAGVICSEHRAVRLQNGSSPCQGRVEVFYNTTWGTVCSDSFGKEDAEVVCKQLSCGSVRSVDRDVTFGMGFGQIWLDDVHCRLHDSLLWQCPSSPWGEHDCEHKEDVGVICSEINPMKRRNEEVRKKKLRLAAGFNNCSGRIEIFFNDTWGTVCDDSWDQHDAAVTCRQLNCGDPVWTPGETLFDTANGTIWLDDVKCKGSEDFLWDCQFSTMGDHDCEHKEDVHVICSGHPKHITPFKQHRLSVFIIPSIFLVLLIAVSIALATELQRSFQKGNSRRQNSTTAFPDPVYEDIDVQELDSGSDFQSNSTLDEWEYYAVSDLDVCDDKNMQGSFTSYNAEFKSEYDDVQSFETEWMFDRKGGKQKSKFKRNTNQVSAVGSSLQPPSPSAIAEAANGKELRGVRLVGPEAPCVGELKVYYRRQWSSVCSEHRQVRLTNGESVCDGRVEVYYGGVWGRVMDTEWNFNDADVVCRQLNCRTAISVYNHSKFGKDHIQVRLADGGSRCAGRLDLYYNGTWGTVCDDSWDLPDARVVCDQLKCGQSLDATVSGWFGPGAGPIWLHNLKCTANDSVLWECPAGPRAQSDCNHKEDAGVICSEFRLAAGFNNCSGRVDILFSGTWGMVCGDSWDRHDTAVVCRQLNCGYPVWSPGETLFGPANGTTWMDDVKCKGSERFLWDCLFSAMGDHDCEHKEDVNVICPGRRF
ncbi:scavenger receptor cysteine-rich type 1 protein M130-like, partial [Carcharodon carcharias]|uniref:scavenger receptor cysteine-rich type 1 protein M130-like n=1 Tax=Carcharodon carcharias TaxID=13397 RepID=UPI001B7E36A4